MSLLQAKLQVHNREARRKAHDLALVQLNKTRGCSYCWCALTSAVQCGVDTITNGATCGWDAIRECTLAQDDAEVHTADNDELDERQEAEDKSDDEEDDVEHDEKRQLLSQREGGRRRRKNWFKKTTKTVVKAVTCFTKNVAKTCNVPKSCNVGESFNDCFNEIKGTVKNAINEGGEYMDMISDTGCTSLNSCKSKVTDGLDAVWNVVDNALGALEDAVVSEVSSKLPNPSGVAKKMANGAGNLINTVGSAAVSIGNKMGSFFSNYQKFDLGDCCLRGDQGAWYMEPTDCGAFSKLGSVFTDMTNAQSNFNSAVDKFEER